MRGREIRFPIQHPHFKERTYTMRKLLLMPSVLLGALLIAIPAMAQPTATREDGSVVSVDSDTFGISTVHFVDESPAGDPITVTFGDADNRFSVFATHDYNEDVDLGDFDIRAIGTVGAQLNGFRFQTSDNSATPGTTNMYDGILSGGTIKVSNAVGDAFGATFLYSDDTNPVSPVTSGAHITGEVDITRIEVSSTIAGAIGLTAGELRGTIDIGSIFVEGGTYGTGVQLSGGSATASELKLGTVDVTSVGAGHGILFAATPGNDVLSSIVKGTVDVTKIDVKSDTWMAVGFRAGGTDADADINITEITAKSDTYDAWGFSIDNIDGGTVNHNVGAVSGKITIGDIIAEGANDVAGFRAMGGIDGAEISITNELSAKSTSAARAAYGFFATEVINDAAIDIKTIDAEGNAGAVGFGVWNGFEGALNIEEIYAKATGGTVTTAGVLAGIGTGNFTVADGSSIELIMAESTAGNGDVFGFHTKGGFSVADGANESTLFTVGSFSLFDLVGDADAGTFEVGYISATSTGSGVTHGWETGNITRGNIAVGTIEVINTGSGDVRGWLSGEFDSDTVVGLGDVYVASKSGGAVAVEYGGGNLLLSADIVANSSTGSAAGILATGDANIFVFGEVEIVADGVDTVADPNIAISTGSDDLNITILMGGLETQNEIHTEDLTVIGMDVFETEALYFETGFVNAAGNIDVSDLASATFTGEVWAGDDVVITDVASVLFEEAVYSGGDYVLVQRADTAVFESVVKADMVLLDDVGSATFDGIRADFVGLRDVADADFQGGIEAGFIGLAGTNAVFNGEVWTDGIGLVRNSDADFRNELYLSDGALIYLSESTLSLDADKVMPDGELDVTMIDSTVNLRNFDAAVGNATADEINDYIDDYVNFDVEGINTVNTDSWFFTLEFVNGNLRAAKSSSIRMSDAFLAAGAIHNRYTGYNLVRDHFISGAAQSGYGYFGQSPCDDLCNPCDMVTCDPCDPCGTFKKPATRTAWVNYVGRNDEFGAWNINSEGVQVGTDLYRSQRSQFGALFGYEDGRASASPFGQVSRVKSEDMYAGLYAARVLRNGADVRALYNYGWQKFDTVRAGNTAKFDGNTQEITLEAGKRYYRGSWSVRPLMAMDVFMLHLDAARESGGLAYNKVDLTQLFVRSGFDVQYQRNRLALTGGLSYAYDVRGKSYETVIAQGGLSGALRGATLGRELVSFNAGGSYRIGKSFTVFGGYDGGMVMDRNDDFLHTGYVGGSWKW